MGDSSDFPSCRRAGVLPLLRAQPKRATHDFASQQTQDNKPYGSPTCKSLQHRSPVADKNLIKLSRALSYSFYTVNNHIDIFTTGNEKFNALKQDLRNAKKSIYLQYYIFSDDTTGQEIADILIRKARDGVDVKVIYDHVGSFSARSRFFKRMSEAGVETHPFFRVTFPQLANRINWRNHRKIVVIDGETGYLGE